MRMNAADIQALFSQVNTGTRVTILNEPVKYAVEPDGRHYIEVHRPLSQNVGEDTQRLPIAFSMSLASTIEQGGGDRALIDKALYRRAGYPWQYRPTRAERSQHRACCQCRIAALIQK
jgi:L,D-transpeptidase YnhG